MPEKIYKSPDFYEKKLNKVMERLAVEHYDWDYNRSGAYVTFVYKGQQYRFDHTVAKSKENGNNLNYGSDCFAQIVLALEDLVRIINRGIYDLQSWVAGMRYLPQTDELPWFISYLGFTNIPSNADEIDKAFKKMAKIYHPDVGGTSEQFQRLQTAKQLADEYIEKS